MEEDMIERRSTLKKKIDTMEWDRRRNQLHDSRKEQLAGYKKELAEIDRRIEADEAA